MSFSSRQAFENRQRALDQVPSLDDQESRVTDIPSASSELSSALETEMLDNESTPKPTPRHIPVLSEASNLSNSKSLFFSLPSALLAAELAPLLDFANSSVLARTCRRSRSRMCTTWRFKTLSGKNISMRDPRSEVLSRHEIARAGV